MDHEPVLISTIAIGLTAAFIGGLLARRLRLPEIVGYIAAGVAIGPFTPGLSADTDIALELAELGVILLMFGVGIEFSIRDLLAVRSIAIPGAIVQTIVGTALGIALGHGPWLGARGRADPGARVVHREHGRAAARAGGPQRARYRRRAGSPSAGSSSRTCWPCSSLCSCRRSPRFSARPGATGKQRSQAANPSSTSRSPSARPRSSR